MQHNVGIPMGTNYAPLLANLLISVFVPTKTDFIKLHHEWRMWCMNYIPPEHMWSPPFRLSVDYDHYTLFHSVIFFYTLLSFLWSLLLPFRSCQFTLTCMPSPFILCQIHWAIFDLLYPLLPLSCVVVRCTHNRCFGHASV